MRFYFSCVLVKVSGTQTKRTDQRVPEWRIVRVLSMRGSQIVWWKTWP